MRIPSLIPTHSCALLTAVVSVLVVIAAFGAPALAAPATGPSPTDVTTTQASTVEFRLVPTDSSIDAGERQTFDVVAEGITDGILAMRVTVETSDAAVLAVTNGTSPFVIGGDPNPDVDSPSSAQFFAFQESVTGTVTIGTLTVEGRSAGTAELRFTQAEINYRTGDGALVGYDVVTRNGTVQVTPTGDTGGPPAVVGTAPPSDPDGDGLYEDIDGNGQFTILDVVDFLAVFDDATVREYSAAFDFNADGRVSILDVVALLDEV
jgi:PKD repeat protein